MKKILALVMILALMPVMALPAFAATEKTENGIVDVGNKICPVMGSEASPTITAEYKGKIYHFCCPMCVQTFNQDPEKYSKIAEDERTAQKAK